MKIEPVTSGRVGKFSVEPLHCTRVASVIAVRWADNLDVDERPLVFHQRATLRGKMVK